MLPLLLLLCAQDIELGESVITAPRSAAPVTQTSATRIVLRGEQLAATGERSLSRAIGRAAGVWMQETNMGGGAPIVRGLLGSHILIMVDGVRLNDSTTRLGPNQSLNSIDPAIVERVEILRGSNSVLYGSDAIGGVVSIWTKRRRAATQDPQEYLRPYQGEFEGTYGTVYEGSRVSLNLSAALQNHGMLGVASGFDFDDYKAGSNEVVPNTGYNGQALFASYEYALGSRRTMRFVTRVSRDFNVPRTDKMNTGFGQTHPSCRDYRYSLQDRRGWLLSYTDERPGEFADRMQLRLNLNTYEEERDIAKTGSAKTTFEQDRVTTLGLGLDWQRSVGNTQLVTWGFDAYHDDVSSIREETEGGVTTQVPAAFAPESEYGRFGMFVQDEFFSCAPWFFTLGVRYSIFDFQFGDNGRNARTSDQFSALTASVEAARDLGDGVVLTASLAQGFRAPNLDDLANDGQFAGGTELANPDLDPEKSLTLEGALEVKKRSWSGTVSLFGTQIEDYIGRVLLDEGDPNRTGDETYLRENSGELDLVGTELSLWQRLGGESSAYSVDGSIAYVYGWQRDSSMGSGNVPARRIPPLHGHLALNYEPEEREFFYLPNARFAIIWADGQDRLNPLDKSDPRIDPQGTAGWVTYNLDVWGEFNPDASWTIGLTNLTDESYRVHGSGADAPGRGLVVGLHLEF